MLKYSGPADLNLEKNLQKKNSEILKENKTNLALNFCFAVGQSVVISKRSKPQN